MKTKTAVITIGLALAAFASDAVCIDGHENGNGIYSTAFTYKYYQREEGSRGLEGNGRTLQFAGVMTGNNVVVATPGGM